MLTSGEKLTVFSQYKGLSRGDSETEDQMTRQSQTSDTKDYLADKMARSIFTGIKEDLELQMENILTKIVYELKDQARDHNEDRYQGGMTRYKREDTMPQLSSHQRYRRENTFLSDRRIIGRSLQDPEESLLYRSSRKRKPMRKPSGNTDRKDLRITERRSKRLQAS